MEGWRGLQKGEKQTRSKVVRYVDGGKTRITSAVLRETDDFTVIGATLVEDA